MTIDPGHPRLAIVRQCELVSISRASFYRRPAGESPENLELMRLIDETFLECPFYGARQMARHLRRLGWCLGRKRVRRVRRENDSPDRFLNLLTAQDRALADLPGAEDQRTASAAHDLSLPAAAYDNRPAQPGLVC